MAILKFKRLLAIILVCCCIISMNFHALLLNATDTIAEDVVTSIAVVGAENGVVLWQGFEISPYDYDLTITYESGATNTIPMTIDMIGEYDNITVGSREVTVSYSDVSTELSFTVNERKSVIDAFGLDVKEHVDAINITLSDHAESIRAFKKQYDAFSSYEVSLLDDEVVQKYQALVDRLYRLEHSELATYDTVYTEDFNRSLHDDEWTIYSTQSSGSWRTFNSILVNEQLRYGWSSTDKKISYLDYVDFYGEVNSVEADVFAPSDETGWFASILSCVNADGYYMARIYYTGTYSEGYGKIQLLKYADGVYTTLDSCNASKWVDWSRKTLNQDAWNNLRLTVIDGKLTVYLNDVQMIQYVDDTFTTGTFGLRSNCGDMRYDSLRVMGTTLDSGEYIPRIEETYFEDSFSDEQYVAGGEPNFWIEETDSNLWSLFDLENDGNLSYGTNSKQYSYTWLHTFEKDPTIQMDFMVSNAEEDGRIEFLTRYAGTMECYAGIGYDFSQSKWYIYTDKGEDFDSRIFYTEEAVPLKDNMWHTIRIEEEGRCVQVYLDDVLVIEDADAYMTGYGRVGVLSENTNLYIDNFSYTMPHGGSVSDGVSEILFDYDTYGTMSHMEVESLGEGTLLGIQGGNRYLSTDNGLSWDKITDKYTAVKGKGINYPSVLHLEADTYLMVYADTFSVWKSTDGMKNWTQLGTVSDDIGNNKTEDGQWKHIIHINSLSKVKFVDENGAEVERIFLPVGVRRFLDTSITGHYTRVFYSDDYGETWIESTNDTRSVNPTYEENGTAFSSWCEAKIIMGSDSVLRMYNTREYNCTVYTESYDYGETWEGIYSIPYLQNSQSSYGIVQDSETGIYYMACLNNVAASQNSIIPRNRLSLVRSTDGKNWEFVMDIERFSSCANYLSTEIYQILDPSISIVDGYMYITMGRSYAASSGHNRQSVRMVRLDMSKLQQSTPWNDSNIADATRAKTLEISTDIQREYSVGDTFTLDGGIVKATAFNGSETYYDMNELHMISEAPDMSTQGVYEVILMNDYAQTVSFEVGVGLESYQIDWKVSGKGNVSSMDNTIYEGQRKAFNVIAEEGWKLSCVVVNGKFVDCTNNQITIIGSEDINVNVIFVQDTEQDKEANELVHYEDTFTTEASYNNAVDVNGDGVSNWKWNKDSLTISKKANWFSLFGGVHVRKNYTISADVRVPSNDYLGVVAYGSTNAKRTVTYGYEFAIYNDNFRLYSRGNSGSYVLPESSTTPAVSSYFPTYKSGEMITLSLTAITTSDNSSMLICKATYKGVSETIFVVVDDQYSSGMAGIRGNSVGSVIENVRITNAEPLVIDNVILNSDDTINVTQEELSSVGYIYEADVTLTDVLSGSEDGIRTVALCVGTGAAEERAGYEFGVVRATDGSLKVRLFDCAKETAIYNASCDAVTKAYAKGESVHLKMVVRENSLRCYINHTYICEYNPDNNIGGMVGVRGEYVISILDNISVSIIQDNYLKVDTYRSGDTYMVPDNSRYDGCVFGGWYIDRGFKIPLNTNTKVSDAYAKWVDADVLSVKAQISANLLDKNITNDSTASIRFVTTVDSLDYQKVGFVFSIGDQAMTVTSKVVYKELYAVGTFGGNITYAPWEEFSPQSTYFKAFTFTNLPKEDYDKKIGVKSYWLTLDGTYVYGDSVVKTVNMGISGNDGSHYDGDEF